jgi:hypothetical protein
LVDGDLTPLATRTALKDHVSTNVKVTTISRLGFDTVI